MPATRPRLTLATLQQQHGVGPIQGDAPQAHQVAVPQALQVQRLLQGGTGQVARGRGPLSAERPGLAAGRRAGSREPRRVGMLVPRAGARRRERHTLTNAS